MSSPFTLIGYWVTAAMAIWLSATALAYAPVQGLLFQRVYGSNMGHHVAGQLARAADGAGPVCLLVGLSTTRAALLTPILEQEAPPLRFVEVTSAGGSIFGVELIVDMIRSRRLKPACIVLGLHSHLLKERTLALWPAGFLDVTTPDQQVRFIPREVADERTRTLLEALRRALWPPVRLSTQFNALIRDGLHASQWILAWRVPLARSEFERRPGDLALFDDVNAPIERAFTAEQRQRFFADLNRQRLLDADTYAKPAHLESLRNLLAESLRLSPIVIVDVLPESEFARSQMSPLADAPFQDVVAAFTPRLRVFDDRTRVNDDGFDVAFHLLRPAAETYSRDFGKRLAPLVSGQ